MNGFDELRLTYLGWQGWCVESPDGRILIDPLLVDQVGRGPDGCRTNFMFTIPRLFHFEALGSVDAVYLSHEHEDHFNIPTLARLDRRIPLIVSGLMSVAGRTLLVDMGFRVDCVWSGDVRIVGDLEMAFFGPDHTTSHSFTDEWDTTGFLVRHRGGHGAFASNVDTPVGPAMRVALEAERAQGMEAVLFNEMVVEAWAGPHTAREWRAEDAHRSPMGPSRDPVIDLQALRAGGRFAPLPGEVVVLRNGTVQDIYPRAAFLEALPGQQNVLAFSNQDSHLKEPVVGRKTFDPALKHDLENELRRLAEHLYGGPLFRLLMSIGNAERAHRRTFAISFVVDAEGTEWVYEYQPLSCDFVQVDAATDQLGDYLGAMLLWATDFWAVASGEVEPRVLARAMVEARADERIPRLTWMLWSLYHPLRNPRRVLEQYRKAMAIEGDTPAVVFPRRL